MNRVNNFISSVHTAKYVFNVIAISKVVHRRPCFEIVHVLKTISYFKIVNLPNSRWL